MYIVYLQTGPLSSQLVQGLSDIGQLLLVQPPHITHLPGFRLILLFELNQQGRPFTFQLLDPLDVVGEAVVEVSELIFSLYAELAGGAGAGHSCAVAAGGAAGAAARAGGRGGGRSHDRGGLEARIVLSIQKHTYKTMCCSKLHPS